MSLLKINKTKWLPWIMGPTILFILFLQACGLLQTTPMESEGNVESTPFLAEQVPTYKLNAANWADGPPLAMLEFTVDGLEITASGRGLDLSPGGNIASCSYNFGDNAPPVKVPADESGKCEAVHHTYSETGGYDLILAVWDDLGMIGQEVQTVLIGETPGVSERMTAHINDCLEAYAWSPAEGGPFPTIVHYTPYQIDEKGPSTIFIASGAANVYVTNRGQGSSCDTPNLFGEIAQNDLLLIDQWLSEQPWATGEYCLQGHSGPGIMGTLSGTVHPPGLKCAFVGGGDTKLWEGITTKSGAWWPLAPMWVIQTYGEAALQASTSRIPALIDYLVAFHSHSRDPRLFDERDRTEELLSLDVPILFETSWDDLAWGAGPYGGPYLDVVQDMIHPGSAVIVYPGPHPSFDPSNERPFRGAFRQGTALPREIRDFIMSCLNDNCETATSDFNYLYFQLKGGVQAALMNGEYGGWQTSTTWPPQDTAPVTLYLHPDPSGTVASRYDGTLSLNPPTAGIGLPPFPYQPAPVWDPVYSSGGTPWKFYSFPDMRALDQAGLTFTSPPLADEAVVQGPVYLTLTAETDLYDFDWMVILSDVWADGSSHRLSSGFIRASLRNDPALYQPRPEGEQTYQITLASIANIFQADHRIRLSLHQVNSDGSDPTSKETTIHLGVGLAEINLYVNKGRITTEPYQMCIDCDPEATAEETLQAYLNWYITGAVIGRDPISGEQVRVGFWASKDREEVASGALLLYLPSMTMTVIGIDGVAPTLDPDYDYMLVLPNDYRMQLRCSREGDPGTLRITNGALDVGPLEVTEGMIRCYDVPYVNW